MKNNRQKSDNVFGRKMKKLHEKNELLKLKFSAEKGADFHMSESIDPGLENAFLNNVLEFEKQYANVKRIMIYDFIGRPAYKKADELQDEQLIIELERIYGLLWDHGIDIEFLADYPEREKYRFLTEEFFFHETDDISIPNMVQQYIYEEFHPNHKMDITNRSTEFINGWFRQHLGEFSYELAEQWITDKAIIYTRKDIIKKFQHIWSGYSHYENTDYKLLDVHADVNEGDNSGMGYAEGIAKYDAVLKNEKSIHFEGPFKIYLRYEYDWWNIFFVHWPGLDW